MPLQAHDTAFEGEKDSEPRSVVLGFKSAADRELEDLIYSWKRVTDPKLRKIALDLIRSMAS